MLKDFGVAVIAGVLITFPFMVMELVNRQSFREAGRESFALSVFVLLWILTFLFTIILIPIARTVRAGNNLLSKPVIFLLQVVLLAGIAWNLVRLVMDQLPCFLGVPLCD